MYAWLLNVPIRIVFFFFFLTVSISNAAQDENKGINSNGYSLHVGAFSDEVNAERMTSMLKEKGVDAYCFKKNNGVYTVKIGDFPTHEAAKKAAQKLAAEKVISSYFIVSPNDTNKATRQVDVPPSETENSKLPLEAKRVEKYLKSKAFETKFYSECSTSNTPVPLVVCKMYFPENKRDMRYIHEIEAFSIDTALVFSREYSFLISDN